MSSAMSQTKLPTSINKRMNKLLKNKHQSQRLTRASKLKITERETRRMKLKSSLMSMFPLDQPKLW
jgi:hypothetical protein